MNNNTTQKENPENGQDPDISMRNDTSDQEEEAGHNTHQAAEEYSDILLHSVFCWLRWTSLMVAMLEVGVIEGVILK